MRVAHVNPHFGERFLEIEGSGERVGGDKEYLPGHGVSAAFRRGVEFAAHADDLSHFASERKCAQQHADPDAEREIVRADHHDDRCNHDEAGALGMHAQVLE